ncbi:hypothetical protein CDL15_Pgr009823 [Punica granatum]|uniref:Uncharacterized protein n=1 Tax=Punica granatum TaxID=22663 RepID=A0A218WTI5_PUNGR|nr:hypothetical protein CDL15_Pgr009823 [Punica granatum]
MEARQREASVSLDYMRCCIVRSIETRKISLFLHFHVSQHSTPKMIDQSKESKFKILRLTS